MEQEVKPISELTDDEVKDFFEGHKCAGEQCEICHEYMVRFNPDLLVEILFDEAHDLEEILMMESKGTIS